jgi:hypothetical protein
MLLGAGVDPELSKKLSWWPILEENCLVATIHASSKPASWHRSSRAMLNKILNLGA